MEKKQYIITKLTDTNTNPGILQYIYGGSVTSIVQSGTANCQISICYNFQGLLSIPSAEERKQVLFVFNIVDRRKMLLIDVNQVHGPKVEELFKPSLIVFKNNYKSTNGSAMVVYLINNEEIYNKTTKFLNDWNKDHPGKLPWTTETLSNGKQRLTITL